MTHAAHSAGVTSSPALRAPETPWLRIDAALMQNGSWHASGTAVISLSNLAAFDRGFTCDWVTEHSDLLAVLLRDIDRRMHLTVPVTDPAQAELMFDLTVWVTCADEAELAFLLDRSTTYVEQVWLAGSQYRLLSRLAKAAQPYL